MQIDGVERFVITVTAGGSGTLVLWSLTMLSELLLQSRRVQRAQVSINWNSCSVLYIYILELFMFVGEQVPYTVSHACYCKLCLAYCRIYVLNVSCRLCVLLRCW